MTERSRDSLLRRRPWAELREHSLSEITRWRVRREIKPDALEPLIINPVASAWDVLLPTACKPEPRGLWETASAFRLLALPRTRALPPHCACLSHPAQLPVLANRSTQRGCVPRTHGGATVPGGLHRRLRKSCGEGIALMG